MINPSSYKGNPSSWTLKTATANKFEALKLWFNRKMLKTLFWGSTSNEWGCIARCEAVKESCYTKFKIWNTSHLACLLRHEQYELPQLILKRKILKTMKRRLGRRNLTWLGNIRPWTSLNLEELIRMYKTEDMPSPQWVPTIVKKTAHTEWKKILFADYYETEQSANAL